MEKKRLDKLVTVVMIVFTACMGFLPNRFENPTYNAYDKIRCLVLEVDNKNVSYAGVITYGEQSCQVKILSGKNK